MRACFWVFSHFWVITTPFEQDMSCLILHSPIFAFTQSCTNDCKNRKGNYINEPWLT